MFLFKSMNTQNFRLAKLSMHMSVCAVTWWNFSTCCLYIHTWYIPGPSKLIKQCFIYSYGQIINITPTNHGGGGGIYGPLRVFRICFDGCIVHKPNIFVKVWTVMENNIDMKHILVWMSTAGPLTCKCNILAPSLLDLSTSRNSSGPIWAPGTTYCAC